MDKNSIHQKHKIVGTVIRANGRTVGQVINSVFVKDVSKRKHFLHTPEAIAYSLDTLHAAEAAAAEFCEVLDTDSGIRYRAAIAKIWDMGKRFNYGWGEQIYLTLNNWTQSRDPNFTTTDAPFYENPNATNDDEDVKPLNIKSRAAVGIKYTKGTKTLKQMQLFGGRNG